MKTLMNVESKTNATPQLNVQTASGRIHANVSLVLVGMVTAVKISTSASPEMNVPKTQTASIVTEITNVHATLASWTCHLARWSARHVKM